MPVPAASLVLVAAVTLSGVDGTRPRRSEPPTPGSAEPAAPPAARPAAPPAAPTAAASPTTEEMAALSELARHPSWMRRLTATLRLELWPEGGFAAKELASLAADSDARVRASAVLALVRVGATVPAERIAAETDGRVIRAMLRCGIAMDAERVEAGARRLMKSDDPSERMLGAELACALDAQKQASRALVALTRDTFNSIVARLDREAAGTLSPRLAALTGAPDVRVDHRWRSWLGRHRNSYTLAGGMLAGPGVVRPSNALARMTSAEFVRFCAALDDAFKKPIDLGIAIDCTASMSGELAQAQAGVHDVMDFAGAAAGSMRVAVVGYRDRGEEWSTKAHDFTANKAEARSNLWKLRADGGGDEPEQVYEGLTVAYTKFSWRPPDHAQRVMVLIGDAPPHPGFGARSVELARAAKAADITTFVISARDERKEDEVKHFTEIARAGGGRVIRLRARTDLAAELAGVALADTWHDPIVAVFDRYLLLCR